MRGSPTEKVEEKFIKRERLFKLLTMLAIVIAAGIVILKVDNMLVSLILASVIYYTLNPIVNALERGGMDRGLAILIPFVGLGVIVSMGVYLLSPLVSEQMESAKRDLPNYIEGFKILTAKVNKL